MTTTQPESDTLYCANHPQRETRLRCNRCEKPICSECAVLTPTGYRCKECVRGQQKIFETAKPSDYVLGVLTAGFLSFIGGVICSFLGFFTIFVAPLAGMAVAEAARLVIRRRRGRNLFRAIAAAALIGAVLVMLNDLIVLFLSVGAGSPRGALFGLLPLVWKGIYAFLVTSSVYYRLSGIQLRR